MRITRFKERLYGPRRLLQKKIDINIWRALAGLVTLAAEEGWRRMTETQRRRGKDSQSRERNRPHHKPSTNGFRTDPGRKAELLMSVSNWARGEAQGKLWLDRTWFRRAPVALATLGSYHLRVNISCASMNGALCIWPQQGVKSVCAEDGVVGNMMSGPRRVGSRKPEPMASSPQAAPLSQKFQISSLGLKRVTRHALSPVHGEST